MIRLVPNSSFSITNPSTTKIAIAINGNEPVIIDALELGECAARGARDLCELMLYRSKKIIDSLEGEGEAEVNLDFDSDHFERP